MTSSRYAFSVFLLITFAIYGAFLARHVEGYAGGSDSSGYMNNARYSGNGVPGSRYRPTCDSPARQLAAYESWHRLQNVGPEIDKHEFLSRLVYVGWPRSDSGGSIPGESDASFGPPPARAIAKLVSLAPLALQKRQSQLAFEIAVRNKRETRITARSFSPVRVSWRFVEIGTDPKKGKGWDPRFQIPKDILPGGGLNVTFVDGPAQEAGRSLA
jgi:hypothetical protein